MRSAGIRIGTRPHGRTRDVGGDRRDPSRVADALLASLPVAGAIFVERDGRPVRLAANAAFAGLADSDDAVTPLRDDAWPFGPAVAALLADADASATRRFPWTDGDAAAGRHLGIMLARIDVALGERGCLSTLVDHTAELATARSLTAELVRDSLTGLPNRAAFADAVDGVGVAAGGHAVLLVDLARFSRVNASLGVMAGDETIITVARRLISTLRAGDLVARVGGDEFGLLVSAARSGEALAAADRVRRVLAAPIRLSRFEVALECAVGCALSDGEGSGEELVRHAQLALKRAKTTGRTEIFDAGDSGDAMERLELETELRRAIGGGALTLAFQPIVDLADDRLAGFEALTRWRHPRRGPIHPDEFIAIAEETGQIVALGRWALDSAIATLAAWDRTQAGARRLSMAVNVSPIQLVRDDVPALVESLLARHGVAGDRLTIELTESAIIQDPDRASRALQALKSLDVRIAMDDFGTGYSNLAYLRSLPIDVLKIDRSFVTGMRADRDKGAIVRAVLSLASALGKRTIAEGVETSEVGHALSALGCDQGQGFLFGAPMPAADAAVYLASRG